MKVFRSLVVLMILLSSSRAYSNDPDNLTAPTLKGIIEESVINDCANNNSQELKKSKNFELSNEGPNLVGLLLLGEKSDVNVYDSENIRGLQTYNLQLPEKTEKLQTILSASFFNKPISKDNIIELKRAITSYYQKENRPVVVVHVPQQDISTGVLQCVVSIGKLGKVCATGNKYFSSQKLVNYIQLNKGDEIDSKVINRDIFWINRNPFRNVNVIYSPGEEVGTTDIELLVNDRYPLRIYSGIDNTGNKITKRNRIFAGFNCGKLFGTDQQLSYQYTTSDDFKSFQAHTLYYDAPLPWRHYVVLFGGYSHVKGKYFSPDVIGISFKDTGFSAQGSFRYDIPLYPQNALLHEVSFGFDFKRTNNNLELGGIPVVAKHVNLTQLMLGYNLGYVNNIITTSFEIEGFWSPVHWVSDQTNATYQTIRPFAKSKYVYLRSSCSLILRYYKKWAIYNFFRGQYANQNLLPSEEFGLGGYNTVRGYPERAVNGDNAFIYNIELRTPPVALADLLFSKSPKWKDEFQILMFFDIGWEGKHKASEFEKKSQCLLSVGPGMRYNILPHLTSRFDYGIQLKNIKGIHSDHRIHFSVVVGY